MKTDAKIQEDVLQELKWDPKVTHERIGVSVSDGIVSLTGTVPSYLEKSAAEEATQRVMGVKAVVEKIDVKFPGEHRRDDQEIAEAVLLALQWHVQIPDKVLKVSVKEGWVTVVGQVEWEFQRNAIEDAIRALSGITGVSNNVTLKSRVLPENIKMKIEEALKRSAEREAKRIQVGVHEGTVTLSGEVHSFAELKAVKGAAWSAPGVTTIVNNLTIAA